MSDDTTRSPSPVGVRVAVAVDDLREVLDWAYQTAENLVFYGLIEKNEPGERYWRLREQLREMDQ